VAGIRYHLRMDAHPVRPVRRSSRVSATRRPALDIISHSPDQTRALGAQLGRLLERGDSVLLSGTIGSGKTTFTQGLARALKIRQPVGSPTFTLVVEHEGRDAHDEPLRLYHIDLYRMDNEADAATFGFEELLDTSDGVAVVEWPERAGAALPEQFLVVHLVWVADTKRQIEFLPRGARFVALVDRLHSEVAGVRG
jgi:tRNA threonylcarbamoyladenosine biosynthesis protein TsaE